MSAPRKLTAEDLDLVRRWQEAAPASGGLTAPMPDEEAFAWDDAEGLVVILRGRRVLDEAELHLLWTRPSARRQGWGETSLRWWLDRLRAAKNRRVLLEVGADNAPAARLYGRLGFVEVGRRRGYYEGADARVMALEQISAGAQRSCDDDEGEP